MKVLLRIERTKIYTHPRMTPAPVLSTYMNLIWVNSFEMNLTLFLKLLTKQSLLWSLTLKTTSHLSSQQMLKLLKCKRLLKHWFLPWKDYFKVTVIYIKCNSPFWEAGYCHAMAAWQAGQNQGQTYSFALELSIKPRSWLKCCT